MKRFEIRVDEENNSEAFWDELPNHVGGGFGEPIRRLLADNRVEIDAVELGQLLPFLRGMPGWAAADAPAHAPNPVIVREITRAG